MADAPATPSAAPASPLAAVARAAGRAGQLAALEREIAKEEAALASPASRQHHQKPSQLRLRALLALKPALALPAAPLPGGLANPGARERLVVELGVHQASGTSGGGHAVLQARWRADLAAHNPGAAAHPEFTRLAEGVLALPPLAEALRDLSRAARVKQLAPRAAVDALASAVTPLSPQRFPGLCAGVPAAWLAAALAARLEPGPFGCLAAECDAALEAAGRLRESQQSPTWELAALASVVFARVCSALALYEELSSA